MCKYMQFEIPDINSANVQILRALSTYFNSHAKEKFLHKGLVFTCILILGSSFIHNSREVKTFF